MAPSVSVILSTYNQPRLLDLTLFGYSRQSALDFEVVVADDGSGSETRAVIERHSRELPVRLEHVWQPDEGFRKAQAVNRAVLRSRAPYLIFSDGDCIPSRTFVEEHLRARRPSTYVVGGHVRLSEEVTGRLTPQDVLSGRVEKMSSWVDRAGLWWTHLKSLVYIATNKRRKPKFYGLNFSLDREVFYRVNGYDLSYENLAREDSDLRNRLQLAGVRARSLWHRARVFHQHHPPNVARLLWREGVAYYNRPDLRPEAPRGLRELEREADAFGGR